MIGSCFFLIKSSTKSSTDKNWVLFPSDRNGNSNNSSSFLLLFHSFFNVVVIVAAGIWQNYLLLADNYVNLKESKNVVMRSYALTAKPSRLRKNKQNDSTNGPLRIL